MMAGLQDILSQGTIKSLQNAKMANGQSYFDYANTVVSSSNILSDAINTYSKSIDAGTSYAIDNTVPNRANGTVSSPQDGLAQTTLFADPSTGQLNVDITIGNKFISSSNPNSIVDPNSFVQTLVHELGHFMNAQSDTQTYQGDIKSYFSSASQPNSDALTGILFYDLNMREGKAMLFSVQVRDQVFQNTNVQNGSSLDIGVDNTPVGWSLPQLYSQIQSLGAQSGWSQQNTDAAAAQAFASLNMDNTDSQPTFPIWTDHPPKFDGIVANFIAVVYPKVAVPGKGALGFNGQPTFSLHFGQSPSL